MKQFAVVLVVLGVSTAVAAFPASAQEAPAVLQQAAQQEKKICRSERMTGSLTRVRRTCLTKAQWDLLAENTRRNIDAVDRDGNQGFAQNPNGVTQGMVGSSGPGGF